MKLTSLLFIGISCLFIVGCGKESTNKNKDAETLRYKYYNLQKNGWKSRSHTHLLDHINYTATEVPLEFYIAKEMGVENIVATDSVYNENERDRILEFEFLHDEEKDLIRQTSLNHDETVKYLSFGIQNDFYVVTQKSDTIKCSGVLYERTFKVAPSERLLLFFTGINPGDKIQLVYNDRLFGKGTIKFRFNEKLTPFLL